MYYVHQPSGRRKERRQAALLIAISALFIIVGGLMVAGGETGTGWAAIIFFSACLLVGVARWRGSRRRRA